MYLDFVGLPGCGSPRSFPPGRGCECRRQAVGVRFLRILRNQVDLGSNVLARGAHDGTDGFTPGPILDLAGLHHGGLVAVARGWRPEADVVHVCVLSVLAMRAAPALLSLGGLRQLLLLLPLVIDFPQVLRQARRTHGVICRLARP